MNAMDASSNSIASIKQIFLWWFIYILLDTLVFAILSFLHQVYINPNSSSTLSDIYLILGWVLFALFGKSTVIPQYPVMIILVFLLRRKLKLKKSLWLIVPLSSFCIAYFLLVALSIYFDYSDSWSVAIGSLKREFGRWVDYQYALNATRPISMLSTIIATGPWLFLISRKWAVDDQARASVM